MRKFLTRNNLDGKQNSNVFNMAFYLQINLKERAGTPTRPFQIMFQRELSDDNLCGNFVLVVLHGHDVEAGSEIVAEALGTVALDFG